MSERAWLNGYDCFMQAVDWELRKGGFAGFLSQIVLELEGGLTAEELRGSVDRIAGLFAVVHGKFRRALPFLYPYWGFSAEKPSPYPMVREHRVSSSNRQALRELRLELFNTPLATRKGELLRFDLVDREDDGRSDVIMTWHHPLMDSHGAESLLSLVGDPEREPPDPWLDGEHFAGSYTRRLLTKQTYKERLAEGRRSLKNIDSHATPAPVSLHRARRSRSAGRQSYQVVEFTAEQTEVIAGNARRICGALHSSNFYLWATLDSLHDLHARFDVASPAYVVTLPIDMRPKGAVAPLFSTQDSTIFYRVEAEAMADRASVLGALKSQAKSTFRDNLLPAFLYGMELSRPFPARVFMKLSRHAMKGELGSMFFANTGRAANSLETFLGRRVMEFAHAPAVAAPPGIGIFFYQFADRLRCTVVHVEGMLEETDAAGFAEGIRRLLLNPDGARDDLPG